MAQINDGKFVIKNGQGISQAIAEEIGLTKDQCKKVDWKSVFQIVNEAKGKEGNKVNWKGGNNLFGSASANYVVRKGDVFEFSKEIWTRIVDTVKNSLTKKGVNTENLNTQYIAPEPYEESTRYSGQGLGVDNDAQKEVVEISNGKKTIFKNSEGKVYKEVSLYNDNTTEVKYYDKNGVITHSVKRDDNGLITYAEAFDKDGNKISWQDAEGNVHLENGSKVGIKFSNIDIAYNDQGEELEILEFDEEETGKILKSTHVLTKYGDKSCIETTTDYIYNDDGILVGQNLYDSDGKLVKVKKISPEGYLIQSDSYNLGTGELKRTDKYDASEKKPIDEPWVNEDDEYVWKRDEDGIWSSSSKGD